MESPIYRIEVDADLQPSSRSRLYRFLENQFRRIEGTHPAFQSLHPDEFEEIVNTPSCFTILCHEHTVGLVGAMIVTTDITTIAWASAKYFADLSRPAGWLDAESQPRPDQQPRPDEQPTPVFFVASLAVAKSTPPQVINGLIDRLTDIVAESSGVAVADIRDHGHNHSLARHIAGRVAMRYESEWRPLGSQTYHAFRPGRPVPTISSSEARKLVAGRSVDPEDLRRSQQSRT